LDKYWHKTGKILIGCKLLRLRNQVFVFWVEKHGRFIRRLTLVSFRASQQENKASCSDKILAVLPHPYDISLYLFAESD
jgi:hypothetical protein